MRRTHSVSLRRHAVGAPLCASSTRLAVPSKAIHGSHAQSQPRASGRNIAAQQKKCFRRDQAARRASHTHRTRFRLRDGAMRPPADSMRVPSAAASAAIFAIVGAIALMGSYFKLAHVTDAIFISLEKDVLFRVLCICAHMIIISTLRPLHVPLFTYTSKGP